MKKVLSILLILCLVFSTSFITAFAAGEEAPIPTAAPVTGNERVRLLFTSDMHSYMGYASSMIDGKVRSHGGSDRLATLLKEYDDYNAVYIDGGDFSQGTLYQAGYEDYACELSMLSELGCVALTPGNHEWDHAGTGFANMLNSAMKLNKRVPMMLIGNVSFDGELTEEQKYVKETLDEYKEMSGQDDIRYTIYDVPDSNLKIGFFGVSGESSIEDSPTSGMNWTDEVEAAKEIVSELEGKCDIIVCLSHSGMATDGSEGEDMTLAEEVPGIDFILSGHSHNAFKEPIMVGETVIGSCGEYLEYLGVCDLDIDVNTKEVKLADYKLVPVDENVKSDAQTLEKLKKYKEEIGEGYLDRFGYKYDQVIAHSNFDFMPLNDMYACHQEYPMGNLIADSYRYEAEKNGIDDIDVFLVGLGTIRGSFSEGDIDVPTAFQMCSLGVGADGSAGHPLLSAYITGKELKLLVELDASLGPMVSAIKMSYNGLEYEFNDSRMLLDKVTYLKLVKPDGTKETIEKDKMYKVCCNMYAANMLGMLNGLTKGILSIAPKYEDGNVVEDFYTCSLRDSNDEEIKEWVAFANYLSSFEVGESGLPEIPDNYSDLEGRKVKYSDKNLFALVAYPGPTTLAVIILAAVIIFLITFIICRIKTRKKRKNETK